MVRIWKKLLMLEFGKIPTGLFKWDGKGLRPDRRRLLAVAWLVLGMVSLLYCLIVLPLIPGLRILFRYITGIRQGIQPRLKTSKTSTFLLLPSNLNEL